MYLSKLEILGFKSFAQKTQVVFHHGLTGIVGPNGCGKTNIVDALRWCLGEQKSSTLRSDKMENVIFNGTNARKPMGMAEVSLTIQNDKGILPMEYSEVTITRRIFRSGESEYLLNKNLCRLKDITNLFMDTGMGANAYSVIELKMVESILSNRADDRRVLFEEAAGVNKYKLRRRLTLKKLDEVKADLTRVNDITAEVEKKVNSLERQAKRADKYKQLADRLRELELELAERELALFFRRKTEYKAMREEWHAKRLSIESQLARLDDTIAELKRGLYEVEQTLQAKRSEITQQTEKIHQCQQEISVATERKKSLEENIARYTEEQEELQLQLEETRDDIEQSTAKIAELEGLIAGRTERRDAVSAEIAAKREALEEKQSAMRAATEQSLALVKEISAKENSVTNLAGALKNSRWGAEKIAERMEGLRSTIAKNLVFIDELNRDKRDAGQKLAEAEELLQRKQDEKEILEEELRRLKEQELEERSLLNGVKEKLDLLQRLMDNLEGFSKGTRELIDTQAWTAKNRKLLANIANVPGTYRLAVEAALKDNLNNIIVESLEDIASAVALLNQNESGKASFLLHSAAPAPKPTLSERIARYFYNRKRAAIAADAAFINWVTNEIEAQEEWKPVFSRLFAGNAIVQTLDDAIRLAQRFPGFCFTTINGDTVSARGVIEAGSAPKADDTIFGRKQTIEQLLQEIPKSEERLAKLREEIEGVELRLTSIDLKALAERSRSLINDLNNIDKQVAQFEFEKQKAQDELEQLAREREGLLAQAETSAKDLAAAEQDLARLMERKNEDDAAKAVLQEEFSIAERNYTDAVTVLNTLNLELERNAGEKKNLAAAVKRGEEAIVTITRTIERRKTEIASGTEEAATLASVIEDKTLDLDELMDVRHGLRKEEADINAKVSELRSTITAHEADQQRLRKERDTAGNEMHAADIKLNETDIKIANLRGHIFDTYSLQIEIKAFDDLDLFDFPGRTTEVQSIKQSIKNLGPVNTLAYSEYEEEKGRLEFLLKQQNDLIESEKDLIRTIEEINQTAQTLFMETFEKIRTNFITIFRSLFNPGDEADLRLEENADPLEAKIEIVAKPKGKRPTTIELLSGGEKTLTAIALLFSIYLVKPSPFCILDEIDAPLDDANIDRFTKIIKDFSINTQFIVVTHNKRTMEATDILYGVTMQEEGVSKLVSVKFDEAVHAAS